MDKYYIIFSDTKSGVVRVEKDALNDIYQFIIDHKMVEGSYYIIKGKKIV